MQKSALTSGRQLVELWPAARLATLVKELLLGFSNFDLVSRRGRLQLLCHATTLHGYLSLAPVLPFLVQGKAPPRPRTVHDSSAPLILTGVANPVQRWREYWAKTRGT
jgi:hypothetical protein